MKAILWRGGTCCAASELVQDLYVTVALRRSGQVLLPHAIANHRHVAARGWGRRWRVVAAAILRRQSNTASDSVGRGSKGIGAAKEPAVHARVVSSSRHPRNAVCTTGVAGSAASNNRVGCAYKQPRGCGIATLFHCFSHGNRLRCHRLKTCVGRHKVVKINAHIAQNTAMIVKMHTPTHCINSRAGGRAITNQH